MRVFQLVAVVLALCTQVLPCAGSVSVAVKRGQKTVDPKSLPFADLTITMVGGSLPLQDIVLENLDTHKEITAMLTSSFSDKIEYLTALEGNRRGHAQIILPLKPGRYEIKRVEFNIIHVGQIGTALIDLTKTGHFAITVAPKVVNYCGSLVIAADWGALQGLQAAPNGSAEGSFQIGVSIEKTQARDAKWAQDVIPAMRNLPSIASEIKQY